MPKYYVESGWVRVILDAGDAEQAAVKAFQRCHQRQAEIYAEPPSDIIRDAEAVEWQLADEITVNEIGFGGVEGETFETFDIAAVCQAPRKVSRSHQLDDRPQSGLLVSQRRTTGEVGLLASSTAGSL